MTCDYPMSYRMTTSGHLTKPGKLYHSLALPTSSLLLSWHQEAISDSVYCDSNQESFSTQSFVMASVSLPSKRQKPSDNKDKIYFYTDIPGNAQDLECNWPFASNLEFWILSPRINLIQSEKSQSWLLTEACHS
jgi:hypothetical protein